MLTLKEIKTLEEIKNAPLGGEKTFDAPLFHGTRYYGLQINDDERNRFISACEHVVSFANKYFYSGQVDFRKVDIYHRDTDNMFLGSVVSQYNMRDFQYGDFYVTSSYETAIGFSHQVGGEIGSCAYSQVKGFEALGIEFDEKTKIAASIVKEEYKKYADSEKVVLVFFNIDFIDLHTRGGEAIIRDVLDEEYREAKEDYAVFYSTDYQFRLCAPQKYTAYVLKEGDLRTGFALFTDVTNVDSAIKSHNLYFSSKWDF